MIKIFCHNIDIFIALMHHFQIIIYSFKEFSNLFFSYMINMSKSDNIGSTFFCLSAIKIFVLSGLFHKRQHYTLCEAIATSRGGGLFEGLMHLRAYRAAIVFNVHRPTLNRTYRYTMYLPYPDRDIE